MQITTFDCATGQQVTRDMTPEEEAAVIVSRDPALADAVLQADRDKLVSQIDNPEQLLRAFVLVLLDELNLHATTTTAILTAAANATNLADFKTRTGQITAIPQRTTQQLRTAIRNKLGT